MRGCRHWPVYRSAGIGLCIDLAALCPSCIPRRAGCTRWVPRSAPTTIACGLGGSHGSHGSLHVSHPCLQHAHHTSSLHTYHTLGSAVGTWRLELPAGLGLRDSISSTLLRILLRSNEFHVPHPQAPAMSVTVRGQSVLHAVLHNQPCQQTRRSIHASRFNLQACLQPFEPSVSQLFRLAGVYHYYQAMG